MTFSYRRSVLNQRRLIVCDHDRDYAAALANYIRHSECGYEVVMYSDPAIFTQDINGVDITLLLIQEDFLSEVNGLLEASDKGEELAKVRCYILTEDRSLCGPGSGRIYKYQSAAGIIGIIGEEIEARHRIVNETRCLEEINLIGIYSPVNHTLKTTYSIALGQILAQKQQVLYINMEGYNGLSEMMDIKSEYSFVDLMYEYSLHPEELFSVIHDYSVRFGELDVLVPPRSPFELQELEPALWLSFLSSLISSGRYGVIILDISDTVRGTFDILNVCSRIYMPLRADSFSMAKIRDFTEMILRYPGGEELNNRIVKLKFPYFEDIDGTLNDLMHSRLARYIRSEINIE
jgi:hypothetical protein